MFPSSIDICKRGHLSPNHSQNFPNKPQYLLNGQFSVIGCPYPLGILPITAGEASPENGCSFQLSGIIWKRVSMGLTISRANVLEIMGFFYCQPPKRKIDINRQKVSRYFKSYYFSWYTQTSGSWRISELENQFPSSQKPLCLDIRRPYNLLVYVKYFDIS